MNRSFLCDPSCCACTSWLTLWFISSFVKLLSKHKWIDLQKFAVLQTLKSQVCSFLSPTMSTSTVSQASVYEDRDSDYIVDLLSAQNKISSLYCSLQQSDYETVSLYYRPLLFVTHWSMINYLSCYMCHTDGEKSACNKWRWCCHVKSSTMSVTRLFHQRIKYSNLSYRVLSFEFWVFVTVNSDKSALSRFCTEISKPLSAVCTLRAAVMFLCFSPINRRSHQYIPVLRHVCQNNDVSGTMLVFVHQTATLCSATVQFHTLQKERITHL